MLVLSHISIVFSRDFLISYNFYFRFNTFFDIFVTKILINITKHQNIHESCNKIKKLMAHEANCFFKILQVCLFFFSSPIFIFFFIIFFHSLRFFLSKSKLLFTKYEFQLITKAFFILLIVGS